MDLFKKEGHLLFFPHPSLKHCSAYYPPACIHLLSIFYGLYAKNDRIYPTNLSGKPVVDNETLFATTMISQGILQGVQTMGHCGGKDGVH